MSVSCGTYLETKVWHWLMLYPFSVLDRTFPQNAFRASHQNCCFAGANFIREKLSRVCLFSCRWVELKPVDNHGMKLPEMKGYSASKLFNILHAKELARRLKGKLFVNYALLHWSLERTAYHRTFVATFLHGFSWCKILCAGEFGRARL